MSNHVATEPFDPYPRPDYTITFINKTDYTWPRTLLQCTIPKAKDLIPTVHPLPSARRPDLPEKSTTCVALPYLGKDTGMTEPGIVSLGYQHGEYVETFFECRFLVDPKT